MTNTRDHGGGLDAAIARFGGTFADWIDLSTGINPQPYPIGNISPRAWTTLPDANAIHALENAARNFWNIPEDADVLAAPGASSLIARLPDLTVSSETYIPTPTYNEHAAAFRRAEKLGNSSNPDASVHVYVHPNNPDGKLWPANVFQDRDLTVIDESFCDVSPSESHIDFATRDRVVILKSFGKFWGLAGVRLGFAIGSSTVIEYMRELIGPWPVAGPALEIGTRALQDKEWAESTRTRLKTDGLKLDALMTNAGAHPVGGTDLFRLYDVGDAIAWQNRLADHHIWSRIFPYSDKWLRLGLPPEHGWARLEAAL